MFMEKSIVITIFLILTIFQLNAQNLVINWQNCYGTDSDDRVYGLTYHQNAYYMLGNTEGVLDKELLLIKTDTLGNQIWQKIYGGSDGDGGYSIHPSGEHLIIAGGTLSNDGDISDNPYYPSEVNWIIKIDTAGNILWDRVAGGSYPDQMFSSGPADNGGVYTANRTASNDGDVSKYYGAWDAWFVKYNSEGDIVWDFTLGAEDIDEGYCIIQTSDGGALVGGGSYPAGEGNINCVPFDYHAEAILAKLSPEGDMEWQQCYGGSNNDAFMGLLELENGYLLSVTGGSTDGDCEGCGYHSPGTTETDIWLIRIDLQGNILWHKCYGGYSGENARNVFQTADNGFMIFGETRSTTHYGPNGDITDNPAFSGNSTIWAFKIDSVGNLLWERCIGGQGDEYLKNGVIQKDDDTYILAATTGGPYPNHDVQCENENGDQCFWLMELQDLTVDINDVEAARRTVKLYPNPGSHTIYLETDIRAFTFTLYNNTGQEVLQTRNQKTIHTTALRSGFYYYRITSEGEILNSGKWVKR
jgi:hypothetical protein